MAEILWRTLLSQSSAASLADDDVRELVAEFATGVGESFYWPGSAASQGASTASSGEMLPGTARVAGTGGAIFDSRDGEITATLDRGTTVATATLIHGGSSSSFLIGGGIAIEASPIPEAAAPFSSRWVAVDSVATFLTSGTPANNSFATIVSFGTTFGAVPNVQATLDTGTALSDPSGSVIFGIDNVTTSGCSSYLSAILAISAARVVTITHRSEGTVLL